MLRLPISRWPKLGTRVPLHFFSAPVLLLAVTIVASAAATDLPDAINGIAYSVQLHFLAVTPITATVPDNVLPKGLLLSPDGLIVGTPVIPSDHDFNFTTTVTDSSHPSQTLKFDYHIHGVSDPLPAQTNSAAMGAAKQVRNRNVEGSNSGFDPATFVEIYEDTKAGGHIKIHDPKLSHKSGSHLSVDADSSVVIVPDSSLPQNSDLSLNKLFMSAVLASGDKQQNLEVAGYSEVGKDKSSTDAQRGMAFQTAENIQTVILNMVYTSVDILKYVYGIEEQKRIFEVDVQKTIKSTTTDAAVRQRAMNRFALYKPEIEAIGDFFSNEQNLSLVRVLGKEIFWVDSASLQQIAKQYQENIRIALDPNSQQSARDQAVDQLLERTKLVVDDFRDLLLKVEEEKDFCAVPTSPTLSDPEKNHLKRVCAIEKVSNDIRSTAFQGLTKLFTPGTISLRGAKGADGDLMTLTLEAMGADGGPVGIKAVFEIDIKKYGAKIRWSPSLLFVHRNGVTHAEAFPTAATAPPLTELTSLPRRE